MFWILWDGSQKQFAFVACYTHLVLQIEAFQLGLVIGKYIVAVFFVCLISATT